MAEFNKAKVRLETSKDKNMTRVSIKPEGSGQWIVCMELNFAVQYKVHLYMSAMASN